MANRGHCGAAARHRTVDHRRADRDVRHREVDPVEQVVTRHAPGKPQPSYDKQFVRDWLEAQPWNKTAPGPELPAEVVAGTRERYVAAFERITGAGFERYLQEDVIAP